MSEYCKNCFELQNKIDELETELRVAKMNRLTMFEKMDIVDENDKLKKEKEQLQALCDVYKVCYMAKHKGKTETQIIDEFVMHFAEIIAEEQPDCKNVDYRLPETLRICQRLQEIEKEIIYVAQSIQFNSGKAKPLGDTGSPRSYKRWEKQLDKRLAHEFKLQEVE